MRSASLRKFSKRKMWLFVIASMTPSPHTGYPETTKATENNKRYCSVSSHKALIPVWEQVATDQTDPLQVVPRQVFIPYFRKLISTAFVVFSCVGCLRVTCVPQGIVHSKNFLSSCPCSVGTNSTFFQLYFNASKISLLCMEITAPAFPPTLSE